MKKIIAFVSILFLSSGSFAENSSFTEVESTKSTGSGRIFSTAQNNIKANDGRFQPYGLNYILVQNTEDDQNSLEGHYSFRYSLFDCRRSKEDATCVTDSKAQLAVFFSYTGEFDFYMGTRNSGPVINRTSNPALHFYSILNEHPLGIEFLDIGIEHRSNGQATGIGERDSKGLLKTRVAYNINDYEYFDAISRGSNFVSFTIGTDTDRHPNFHWQASYKAYFTENTDVNWGEFVSKGVDINDYDLVRLSLRNTFRCEGCFLREFTLAGEYTFGHGYLNTDSFEFALIVPLGGEGRRTQFPLMFKYHYGPMDALSNYTKTVSSFGVGLGFSY